MKKFTAMLLCAMILTLCFGAMAEGFTYTLPVTFSYNGVSIPCYIGESFAEFKQIDDSLAFNGSYGYSYRGETYWVDAYQSPCRFTTMLPEGVDVEDHDAVYAQLEETGVVFEITCEIFEGLTMTYDTLTQDSTEEDVITYAQSIGCEYTQDKPYSTAEDHYVEITLDDAADLCVRFSFMDDTGAMDYFKMSIDEEYMAMATLNEEA